MASIDGNVGRFLLEEKEGKILFVRKRAWAMCSMEHLEKSKNGNQKMFLVSQDEPPMSTSLMGWTPPDLKSWNSA